jgi:hypothetical protein
MRGAGLVVGISAVLGALVHPATAQAGTDRPLGSSAT